MSTPKTSEAPLDPEWTFRRPKASGRPKADATTRGKTWHVARAAAAVVLGCGPEELETIRRPR